MKNPSFGHVFPYPDLEGHRGCRGLFPENTIPGFIHALQLGVTTLEMDVVISKDRKVVVSHEPFFSHKISLTPAGNTIPPEEELTHNLFQLNYSEIEQYDVGSLPHPDFPHQKKLKCSKPLLPEVIHTAETFSLNSGRSLPWYNIETKTTPKGDNHFHPSPREFTALLLENIKTGGIGGRTIIQSFDVRTLQLLKNRPLGIKLSLLVENTDSLEQNIDNLGFYPDIYSPDKDLVDRNLIYQCHQMGIKVIPWTVNKSEEITHLLKLGADGIISDYPDLFPKRG